MIIAGDFLKWLEVFNVTFGPHTVNYPLAMSLGGTGASLTSEVNSLYIANGVTTQLLGPADYSVLTTDIFGNVQWRTALPQGVTALTPTTSAEIATKGYVDSVAGGLTPAGPVAAASTVNIPATYNNGASGIGATLTITATGTVVLDGVTTVLNGLYLFKDQTNATTLGIYQCTTAGAVGINGVFTRATTYDTPVQINATGIVPVTGGSTQSGEGFYQTNTIVAIGTTNFNYIRFGNAGTVTSVGTGSGLTGGTITSSGTISFAPISTNLILANLNLSPMPPVGCTFSAIIDNTTGSARGSILYRGSTTWTVLTPGTSGYALTTQGPGADVTWSAVTNVKVSPYIVGATGNYSTIAAAIAQAVTDGHNSSNPTSVVITAQGTPYTENLTLAPGVNLVAVGNTPDDVIIQGNTVYTPGAPDDVFSASGIQFLTPVSGGAAFHFAGFNPSSITFNNCNTFATHGTGYQCTNGSGDVLWRECDFNASSGFKNFDISGGNGSGIGCTVLGSDVQSTVSGSGSELIFYNSVVYDSFDLSVVSFLFLYNSTGKVPGTEVLASIGPACGFVGVNSDINCSAISGNFISGTGSYLLNGFSATGTAQNVDPGLTNSVFPLYVSGQAVELSGSLTTSGAYPVNFNFTGATNVTFPTSGTLLTSGSLPILPLSLAQGGTGAALTASNGGIFYSNASTGAILNGTSTANQIMMSGATAPPAWSTATYPTTITANQILYGSSSNVISGLASGNNNVLVTNGTGVPSFTALLPTLVQGNITSLGIITAGVWNASVLGGAYGGTGVNNGSSLLTYGGNVTFAGAYSFIGNLTGATNVTFPTSGTLLTSGSLPILPLSLAQGGTGASLTAVPGGLFYCGSTVGGILATENNGVLVTDGSGTPSISTTTPAALTIPQPIIEGITNGSVAASGQVGEVISEITSFGSISAGITSGIVAMYIPPGNWVVTGIGTLQIDTGTILTSLGICISNNPNVFPTLPAPSATLWQGSITGTGSTVFAQNSGTAYIVQSIGTIYYINLLANFSVSTVEGAGYIVAQRIV